jgi:hypothetical protein
MHIRSYFGSNPRIALGVGYQPLQAPAAKPFPGSSLRDVSDRSRCKQRWCTPC